MTREIKRHLSPLKTSYFRNLIFKGSLMKVKDPAHAFGILGLAELTVLKGKPWAVFNKGMQMIVYTDAIESVFFPLEVCY